MAQSAYLVVPELIEQPTWGGSYIAEVKHITDQQATDIKIGQSYELSSTSLIATSSTAQPTYLLNGQLSQNTETQSLRDLGIPVPILIKFTQAQENSYQVHVKPGETFNHWLPKPESWYFFEPGKATVGLNTATTPEEYKQRCIAIDAEAQRLSSLVVSGKLEVASAQQQLQAFIETDHPRRFVHTHDIAKGSVIDLSSGGIHHSWEKTDHELGNIVYEVQLDVRDDVCTLRSFDQGKMKPDGSVRELSIEDYFQALDTEPDHQPTSIENIATQNETETAIFSSKHYQTWQVNFSGKYTGSATQLQPGQNFHHVFAKKNDVTITTDDGFELLVPENWGAVVLRSSRSYQLSTAATSPAEVLVTSVPRLLR